MNFKEKCKKRIKFLIENKNLILMWALFLSLIVLFVYVIFLSDILKKFLESLSYFVEHYTFYAYLIAFISAIVEGTILFGALPGTSYVVTAGVFAAKGDLSFWILIPIVIIGAFIGDAIGFFLGRFFSNFMKNKYGDSHYYKYSQKYIKKYGSKSVVYARFISGIKEFVPFIAGILKMDIKTFLTWNFLGAIGWALVWLSVGVIGWYATGGKVEVITRVVGTAFLIFFSTMAYLFYKRNKDKIKSGEFFEEF